MYRIANQEVSCQFEPTLKMQEFEMAHRLSVCPEYLHTAINDAASCRKRRMLGWTTRWCCYRGRWRHHCWLPRRWWCHRLEAMWCDYIGVMPLCEPCTLMATLNMQARKTPSASMHTRRFIWPCMYAHVDYLEVIGKLARRYRLYRIFATVKNRRPINVL